MWISYVRQWFRLTPLELIALTARLEAGTEGRRGMQAVINVIHNRRIHPISRFIANPYIQGSIQILRETRSPYHSVILGKGQFSCYNLGDNMRAIAIQYTDSKTFEAFRRNNLMLRTAVELCEDLRLGRLVEITGGADHYYATYIKDPLWTRDMVYRTTIGRHKFWSEPPHISESPQRYNPSMTFAPKTTPILPTAGLGATIGLLGGY